ncbi:unnamed protein product [Calypogeia fissa]
MAKGGLGSLLTMRLYQRFQNIPVFLLPLVVSTVVITLLIFVTSFKPVVSSLLSERNLSPHHSSTPLVPKEVSLALLHFATTPDVPQQTKDEINVTMRVLMERGPSNFLVFGMWFDSLLWATFNYGGRTVFLEESQEWIDRMRNNHPQLESHKVNYATNLGEASELLLTSKMLRSTGCRAYQSITKSTCPLALTTRQGLPQELLSEEWDVIMIDGPRSFRDRSFPGRMSAIFTAAVMARSRTGLGYVDIFVHDVSRPVEKKYAKEFLCTENLVSSVGDLWHFRVRPSSSADFCSNAPTVS